MAANRGIAPVGLVDIVDAILSSDSDETLRAAASRLGLSLAQLVSWRVLFVDAGTRALADLHVHCDWRQIDLTLTAGGDQYARLVRGCLAGTATRWLDNGAMRAFFYVHKPPGIRLRFQPGATTAADDDVAGLAEAIVAGGGAAAWSTGIYVPEVHLFGGLEGLDLAHAFFTADSEAWLSFYAGCAENRVDLTPDEFSVLLIQLCLHALGLDPWERWDVWMRLEHAGRLDDETRAAAAADVGAMVVAQRVVESCAVDGAASLAAAHGLGDCIQRYRGRLSVLSGRHSNNGGGPVTGLRPAIPFWLAFHWNRAGFDLARQRHLAALMASLLDPRG